MTIPAPMPHGTILPADAAELYRLIRSQTEFEASLITQRLSWFVASQSFLFSAYAITLNAPRESVSSVVAQQQYLLFHLIPVVAIAACTLIYLAILAGVFAQVNLRRFLFTHVPSAALAHFPAIQGARATRLLGLAAPLGLPMVFVAVWVFLLVRGFQHA